MIAFLKRGHGRTKMHLVLCAYYDRIGELFHFKNIFPGLKDVFLLDLVLVKEKIKIILSGLGHSDHFQLQGIC